MTVASLKSALVSNQPSSGRPTIDKHGYFAAYTSSNTSKLALLPMTVLGREQPSQENQCRAQLHCSQLSTTSVLTGRASARFAVGFWMRISGGFTVRSLVDLLRILTCANKAISQIALGLTELRLSKSIEGRIPGLSRSLLAVSEQCKHDQSA